ncbi:hypothetical protein TcWFU_005184 [Taenia crassiceps]|uniref:Uncharacterized protein n=1 Tax=Taenia crassiceps TaxID=6207 RepID=A0ABR4QE67_9CEST
MYEVIPHLIASFCHAIADSNFGLKDRPRCLAPALPMQHNGMVVQCMVQFFERLGFHHRRLGAKSGADSPVRTRCGAMGTTVNDNSRLC